MKPRGLDQFNDHFVGRSEYWGLSALMTHWCTIRTVDRTHREPIRLV
jgi:hypothetical protein